MSKVNLSRFKTMVAVMMAAACDGNLYDEAYQVREASRRHSKEQSLVRMQKLCKDTRVLRKYTIKGVTVFAYSKKDALIRLKHRNG